MTADSRGGLPVADRRNRASDLNPALERLTDLERRSLLAEQMRQQAHCLRTPLSVINLIAETLRMESTFDTERLARIRTAAGSLDAELSGAVNATRFGDDPQRSLDPAALAVEVVTTFGGDVVTAPTNGPAPTMPVESASLEAALVHAMRLVGVGTDCNGICVQRPVLTVERGNGELRLVISAKGAQPADTPRERNDLRLMAQAAERVVNDHGGRMILGPDRVTFRLPLATASASATKKQVGPDSNTEGYGDAVPRRGE
jgi:hypothetical protein